MPLHDDHTNRSGKPKGPHRPPPHGPGHHPHHHLPHLNGEFEFADGLYRQIFELKAMGADDKDLHDLIDSEAERLNGRIATRNIVITDPGRGSSKEPVDALERARIIFRNSQTAEEDWMTDMADKAVLVIGEFRPHLLDRMLQSGIRITQIHPPTPEGDMPPHFHHLGRHGLLGALDFKALAEAAVDLLLFEGVRHSDIVYVSPLVPVTIRMFPNVAVGMLASEHRAPHMSVSIADKGFARIPSFD